MGEKKGYAEAFLRSLKEHEENLPTDVNSVVDRAEFKLFLLQTKQRRTEG